jgi:hypothetical protein
MRKILLQRKNRDSMYAKVDDAEYPYIILHNWRVDNKGYSYMAKPKGKRIFMHQFIMGKYPDGKTEIDHINGDKLDNRKENLRFCTSQENRHNRHMYKNNKSGYIGVQRHRQCNRWLARIYRNKKSIYLGLFFTPEQASFAVQKARQEQSENANRDDIK